MCRYPGPLVPQLHHKKRQIKQHNVHKTSMTNFRNKIAVVTSAAIFNTFSRVVTCLNMASSIRVVTTPTQTLTSLYEPATYVDNNDVWHEIILEPVKTNSYYDFLPTASSNNNSNSINYYNWNVTDSIHSIVDLDVDSGRNTTDGVLANNGTLSSFWDATTWDPATIEVIRMTGTAIALGVLILSTVIGNLFVIAAILLERNLQNVANYLILSLAVADLLVACLVMPLGAVYAVNNKWSLGPELCDMWTSSDVLCCTASILHLVAIATDRYWAVTNIDYIHQRTAKRIGVMIVVVWTVSLCVCIAPLLGWKDPLWENRVLKEQQCLVSQDLGYQIFATASSFYLPLLVILILYWRIFQTARKRIRRRQDATRSGTNIAGGRSPSTSGIIAAAGTSGGIAAAVVTIIGRPLPTISETTTAFTTVSSNNSSPEKTSFANGLEPDLPTVTDCGGGAYQAHHMAAAAAAAAAYPLKRRNKEQADSKRERKAAKTLAIITGSLNILGGNLLNELKGFFGVCVVTGAFVICWLPFFIVAILLPIYTTWPFSDYMVSFFLWLGYFNSTLNPIIYTVFSPEFRHAFNKLLCGRRRLLGRRRAAAARHLGIRHFQ